MLYQIKNWITGKIIFEKDFDSFKLAVEAAVSAEVSLRCADLRRADLRSADLRRADLRSADLRRADLSGAVLSGAVLSGADLSGADLSGAVLSGAVLSGAVLRSAVLRSAVLRSADLSGADQLKGVPVIENIHQRVYEAASAEGALNMGNWHSCETTHCRAGWVTHLAGPAGAAMEWALSTASAAAMIYLASDRDLEKIPDFYTSNEKALEDMKRLAELEATRATEGGSDANPE